MNDSQKNFLDKHLPEDGKAAIIKIAVEQYINEAEAKQAGLEAQIEVEKYKNMTVKDTAMALAKKLLDHEPDNELAKETLALLMEDKMKNPPKRKKT